MTAATIHAGFLQRGLVSAYQRLPDFVQTPCDFPLMTRSRHGDRALGLFAAATVPLDRSDAGRAQFPGNDTIVSGNNGHQFGGSDDYLTRRRLGSASGVRARCC